MEKFVKEIIKNWEGRYHYDELWEDDEYEVNLDSVYEEISRRLSSKMKVVRAAYEYYYSENVNVTVNDKIYFKLVRDCPLKILELWVNNYNSDLERGFWIAPDRLNVFCDMAEYIHDNYGRFEERAKERAIKLKEEFA